ncbi:MAG TPA: hypothetical protein GXX28_05165 [Firmicutes bacterium]|nr:hypothetical protein [Bacillota bacterium]
MSGLWRRAVIRRSGGARPAASVRSTARWLAFPLVSMLMLTGVLSTVFCLPVLAEPFSELPAGHWSFKALDALVAPGLVSASALESYRSRPGVMRFEVALLVARALQSAKPSLTAEQTQALQRLAAEFAPELEILGVQTPADEPAVALDLPASAGGPFVDLDVLLALESGEREGTRPTAPLAARPSPSSPAEMAAAAATPSVLPLPVLSVPGERGALADVRPAQVPLPEATFGSAGSGEAPAGRVETAQKPLQASVPKPQVWSVEAQVEGEKARLPLSKWGLDLTTALKVQGALASDPAKGVDGPGSVQVEAGVNVGGVALGANVRSNERVAPSPSLAANPELQVGVTPATKAAGVSLRVGPVGFSSGVAEVTKPGTEGSTDGVKVERRRQFDLEYTFGRATQIHAGYRLVDLDAIGGTESQPNTGPDSASPGKPRTDASVGVNVNFSETAKLSASLTLEGLRSWWPTDGVEGQRANAGVELRLPWRTFLKAGYEYYRPTEQSASTPSQSATTLGVGYNFADNATLLLGYQLIDFGAQDAASSEPTQPAQTQALQHSLTAGVSFRF